MDFAILPEVLFWGLYAGSIYILLAIGLNLIFGVMKIVNFAHGELLMVSIYVTYFLYETTSMNPYFLVPFTMVGMGFLGVLIERVCFRPIRGSGKLNEIFLSLGLIYFFQNLIALIYSTDFKNIKSPYESYSLILGYAKKEGVIAQLFDVQSSDLSLELQWMLKLPVDNVIMIVSTFIMIILLYFFLMRTETGRAMRATSQNRDAAKLVGINVERMDMLTFGLGASLAAAAGSLWAISGLTFNPYVGSLPAIKAFAVIIFGGLGSVQGAIAGGLIYGIAENLVPHLIGGAWKDAISFVILVMMLVLRPTGLFGEDQE